MSSKSRWKAIIVIKKNVIHKIYDLNDEGGLKKPFKKKRKDRWEDYLKTIGPKMCFPYTVSPHQISNRENVPDIPAHIPSPPTQSDPVDILKKNDQKEEKDERRDTLLEGPPQGGDVHEGSPIPFFSIFSNPQSEEDMSEFWEF